MEETMEESAKTDTQPIRKIVHSPILYTVCVFAPPHRPRSLACRLGLIGSSIGRRRRHGPNGRAHRSPAHGPEEVGADHLSRIVKVLLAVLHKAPPVHIADVGVAVAAEQVEAADLQAEGEDDLASDQLLTHRQDDRVPDFLALLVPLDAAVYDRALARLGVGVVRPHRVNLDVAPAGVEEPLVDVASFPANLVLVRVIGAGFVADFAKEPLAAAAVGCCVIYVDLHRGDEWWWWGVCRQSVCVCVCASVCVSVMQSKKQ